MKTISLLTVLIISLSLIVSCSSNNAEQPSIQNVQTDHDVIIINNNFIPDNISITAGETVRFTNKDGVSHTATADDESWDSETLKPGDIWIDTFNTAGEYTYHCNIHPSMTGTILVE